MAFRNFTATVDNSGNANINIQQENATMEWDVYQISTLCPNPINCPARAYVYLNGFLVCQTNHAGSDTATGPPDVILSRGDTLTISFITGTPGDLVQVSMWYTEVPAGTSSPGLAT